MVRPTDLGGADRLIVALDVSSHDEALSLVDRLDNVSLFKIGLQLFLTGHILSLIKKIQDSRRGGGGVFVDLKLGGDIGNTIGSLIRDCRGLNVKFITLVHAEPRSLTIETLKRAREARGEDPYPQILMVPLLSSMTEPGAAAKILERGETLLKWGCDGLIVSGREIGACRTRFPQALLVSPGIRPDGSYHDDHLRHTTPSEAVRLGSDYLVVGRPITRHADPRAAAQAIIDEVDSVL